MMTTKYHRLLRPLLAVFSGASLTLAFAPYQIWPIAILSPLILIVIVQNCSSKSAALLGFLWGIGQFSVGISWVHISIDTFGGIPKLASLLLMSLLVSYLSIYPALFAGLLNRYFPNHHWSRYLLAIPALWLLTDGLRGWIFTGFPWLWLGYSQIDSPLAGLAPVGGVQLITLASVLCASSTALAILKKKSMWLLVPVIVFTASFTLKSVDWVTPNKEHQTTLALIQGNIAQETKWLPSQRWPTLMKYFDLSRDNWDADIVIWPEAAIPAIERELPNYLQAVDIEARDNGTALITGVITQNALGQYYNSVITLGSVPSGEYDYETQPRYNKHHLLPFGEFVPFESLLRPLAPLFNLPMSSFSPGELVQKNIVAKGRHLATALCYEIIFGDQVRQNITDDTDFILTLSNDAWFGESIGPLQHMEIARMRALELGKPVIRSTNNGVTAVTDYKGQIVAELPQFKEDVLRATISSTIGSTPYQNLGNWPLVLFVVIGLSLSIYVNRIYTGKKHEKHNENV